MINKNVEIAAPFKYLSNFWRPLEMPLINCEICNWSNKICIKRNKTLFSRCEFIKSR